MDEQHDYQQEDSRFSAHPLVEEGNMPSTMEKMEKTRSFSISPEIFEKLYLSPKLHAAGDLRKTLGNPTPIGIAGFVMSLTPLSCCLMGWRGSGESGAANISAYIFFGGILLLVGGVMEFILANTFTAVVFMTFGSFYLTVGTTLQPLNGSFAAYSPSPDEPYKGLASPGFNASYAFFFVFFTVLCFIFFLCTLRTNAVLVWILFTVTIGAAAVTSAFFYAAQGNVNLASKCQIGGAAILFAGCMGGWYLLIALLFAAVDFPIQLPVGDLSHIVPSASQLKAGKEKV